MFKNGKTKEKFYALLLLVVIFGAYPAYLQTLETIPNIDVAQVEKLEVQSLTEGTNFINKTYTDKKTINDFIKALNNARYYREDIGTTHPVYVAIILKNGDIISVWGGGQGFQTIKKGDEQFNIRGWKLDYYLRNFK